ncbi:hypothetical protein Q7P36_007256 [Cladosporium allicinum]
MLAEVARGGGGDLMEVRGAWREANPDGSSGDWRAEQAQVQCSTRTRTLLGRWAATADATPARLFTPSPPNTASARLSTSLPPIHHATAFQTTPEALLFEAGLNMPFYTLLHTVEAFATAARSIYSSDIPTFEPHMRN